MLEEKNFTENAELLKNLPKVRGKYRFNSNIKNWFNVGGNAEVIFRPQDIEDLQYFLQNCSKQIPITILGAASNVIIKDGGVRGVLIKLGAEFAKISSQDEFITVGAAALCGNVAFYSRDFALSGVEFLSGIPGSMGGALAMNAGCYGFDMSKIIFSAKAVDYNGKIHELKNSDFNFSYRENKIAKNFIFTELVLKCSRANANDISQKIMQFNEQRELSQPIRAKTSGSTFKNPNSQDVLSKKAWQLIDEVGFRGAKIGDAEISPKHCNFMINSGEAKASDLIKLGNEAQKAVKEKFDIDLEWEIKIIGDD